MCVDFSGRRLLESAGSGWVVRDDPLLEMVALELTDEVARLADAFWPGPLTLVLPLIAMVVEAQLQALRPALPACGGA